MEDGKGLVWRTILTILIGAASLITSLIYVGFYAIDYTTVQRVVVVLVALIAAAAAIAILWITWAGRRGMMRWGKM